MMTPTKGFKRARFGKRTVKVEVTGWYTTYDRTGRIRLPDEGRTTFLLDFWPKPNGREYVFILEDNMIRMPIDKATPPRLIKTKMPLILV